MKRVSVMANDSLLVDAIASVLAVELGPDVLQLTYQLPWTAYETLRDHRSMLVVIDEGRPEHEFPRVPDPFSNSPLLVIKANLKTMNIDIHKSYQLVNPDVDQVIHIIREFSRMNLKKNPDEQMLTGTSLSSLKDVSAFFYSCVLHLLGRKSVNNVTLSPKRFSGSDL